MKQRLIDANKLAFELNDAQVEYDEFYKGLGKAKIIVENQPTVEPIKGEWVNKGSFIGLIDDYRCSVCDCQPPTKKVNVSWSWNLTNFCPNCGAKMIWEEKKQVTDAERNAEIKVDEAISRTMEKIIKLLGKPVCYSINLEVDGIGYEVKIERCEEHRWD